MVRPCMGACPPVRYGLFVAVWQDAVALHVGGVLDAGGIQEVFEYYPSQPLPVVKRYLHPPLGLNNSKKGKIKPPER